MIIAFFISYFIAAFPWLLLFIIPIFAVVVAIGAILYVLEIVFSPAPTAKSIRFKDHWREIKPVTVLVVQILVPLLIVLGILKILGIH
jgi:hypothetical protein